MGVFHVVTVNKYLDTFPGEIVADKVEIATQKAEASLEAIKSKDKSKSPLAHFKLFANPLTAKVYVENVKTIQKEFGELRKAGKGSDDWALSKMAELK